ncbi:hypothetical protein Tco_0730284 [Tanacetum coccineum]|uniref:Uncharacterized protein n=1 Tax=Tanacetum coccineum TaxID=301880 RepID=A0ABQ4YUE1_9ASTR
MANLLPRLQELATAAKSTMMDDQVLVAEPVEADRLLKRVQHRDMAKFKAVFGNWSMGLVVIGISKYV